jgi:predicted NUDIX family NTP pyrophosphohydrolase
MAASTKAKSKGKKSAGLLVFRRTKHGLEVFLAHMGGPFWQHKDAGAWTIPKGEFESEAALDAARREFQEETGFAPTGSFCALEPVKQPGGKMVFAFALEWDCDATQIKSNSFEMEWPKGSGEMRSFPEIDRAAWFEMEDAKKRILKGQIPLLDELQKVLKIPGQPNDSGSGLRVS